MEPRPGPDPQPRLELLNRHGRALLVLAERPDLRLRDLAAHLHVTERTVCVIIADLERAGYLRRRRIGRRNHYDVTSTDPLIATPAGLTLRAPRPTTPPG